MKAKEESSEFPVPDQHGNLPGTRITAYRRAFPWFALLLLILLAACGGGGGEGSGSDGGNPPGQPQNVIAATGDAVAAVSWDAVGGADSYNLYWSTTSGTGTDGTLIGGVSSGYIHRGLTNATAYYYVVTAVNTDGESEPSAEATATPIFILLSSLSFPDTNLANCVTGGPDTYVSDLTSLFCTGQGITDLIGIEALTNLTYLGLNWNLISDLSALASLTGLTLLSVEHNNISNVSALASLTSLINLSLDFNSVGNVSALASLTGLTNLVLNNNTNISDVSALASLTNLTTLGLFNNAVIDVSPLASLVNLTGLDLGGNNVIDVSALAFLVNLTYLALGTNNVIDVSPLASLTGITGGLDLYNNDVTSGVAFLVTLTSAGYINLVANPNMPCSQVDTLDDTLDGTGAPGSGDGGLAGIVTWNFCT